MKGLSALLLLGSSLAIAQTQSIYLAPAAAGGANGTDCADAYASSFFNTGGNWSASYSAGKISPGTTVYLCSGTYSVVGVSNSSSINCGIVAGIIK